VSRDAAVSATLTRVQRRRERAILTGVIADLGMLAVLSVLAVATGSLTLLATVVRGLPMSTLDAVSLLTLRRLHRQRFAHLGYGPGKIEEVLNAVTAIVTLAGSAWLIYRGLEALLGDRQLAPPLGLATAAAFHALHLTNHFLIWDAQRRVAALMPSVTMNGRVATRRTRLQSAIVVQCTMTLAALSSDHHIALWADVGGCFYVAWVLFSRGRQRLRHGVPELLDVVAESPVRERMAAVLAAHAGGFVRLDGVRSRRSGPTVFIELTAVFDPMLGMVEAQRRATALAAALRSAVPDADVAVRPAAAGGGLVTP